MADQINAPKILPCPFCGASPHRGLGKIWHDSLHGDRHQDHVIKCPHLCVTMTGSAEGVVERWNRRAGRAAPKTSLILCLPYPMHGYGVCVGGRYDGWLMWQHPDGQWVSKAKLGVDDPAKGLPATLTPPPPAPTDSTALVEAALGMKRIVEEIDGVMKHGTWRDERGKRLKDTPEWVALYNALASREAPPASQQEAVAEALRNMLQAVCGETGFAACVRKDSGKAYPWPALDLAEAKALRALKGENHG